MARDHVLQLRCDDAEWDRLTREAEEWGGPRLSYVRKVLFGDVAHISAAKVELKANENGEPIAEMTLEPLKPPKGKKPGKPLIVGPHRVCDHASLEYSEISGMAACPVCNQMIPKPR